MSRQVTEANRAKNRAVLAFLKEKFERNKKRKNSVMARKHTRVTSYAHLTAAFRSSLSMPEASHFLILNLDFVV